MCPASRSSDEPGSDERADSAVSDVFGDGSDDGVARDHSEAFQALGAETRVGILRTLADGEPQTFSDLFAATDGDTSAGFAYHLRQLTDRFVRQRADDRYELTDAGRSAARAVAAGTYVESVDRDPVELDEDCPLCGEAALVASVTDNVTEIACAACESPLLRMALPPGGYADGDRERFADALDARLRRRIESVSDGVCPECAGEVHATVEAVGETPGDEATTVHGDDEATAVRETDEDPTPVQATFDCETCELTLRCPVTLTLLDHPTVVAFYHAHGEDARERPVWNVGAEWRERLVSRDPRCVAVSTRLDEEGLFLYVAKDGTVVDHGRRAVGADEEGGPGEVPDDDTDDPDDDDPDDGSRPPLDSGERGVADAGAEDPVADDRDVTDPSASADGATA